MRLTVFAATGGIGRQILEQAVAAGHGVTAVVRNPKNVPANVRAVAADLAAPDAAALASAVNGADAVLSGLGPRRLSEAGIASKGTRAIVEAMQKADVRRIVVVSAAPIGSVPSPGRPHPPRYDPGDGFFMRHLFGPFARAAFRHHYEDLARMEDLLRASGLDWTIVQAAATERRTGASPARTGPQYEQNLRGGFVISRANIANLMLHVLERAGDDPARHRHRGLGGVPCRFSYPARPASSAAASSRSSSRARTASRRSAARKKGSLPSRGPAPRRRAPICSTSRPSGPPPRGATP